MTDDLNAKNAQKLRDAIAAYKAPVKTPFDHVCHVGLLFVDLLLEQRLEEIRKKVAKPQDRGS